LALQRFETRVRAGPKSFDAEVREIVEGAFHQDFARCAAGLR